MSEHLRIREDSLEPQVGKKAKDIAERPQLVTKAFRLLGCLALVISCASLSPTPVSSNESQTDATHLSACAEITQSGSYVLDRDLLEPQTRNGVCFSIHNTNDVSFNCDKHTIFIGTVIGFDIRDAKGINLQSCNVTSGPDGNSAIGFSKVEVGKISSSHIEYQSIHISQSKNIQITDNTFNTSDIVLDKSQNSEISNNEFTVSKESKRFIRRFLNAFINSMGGSGNKIINNIMDGQSDGLFKNLLGMDDGIVLGSESDVSIEENRSLIQNNRISNVFDCGIETVGLVTNSTISHNQVDNAGVCGIGGWWSNSWQNNIVLENIANKTPALFSFSYKLRSPFNHPSQVFFTDNSFTGNRITNQKIDPAEVAYGYQAEPVVIDYAAVSYYPTDPNSDNYIVLVRSNNLFAGNDLGTFTSPRFNPGGMIVDGGRNICKPGSSVDFPLRCLTSSQ